MKCTKLHRSVHIFVTIILFIFQLQIVQKLFNSLKIAAQTFPEVEVQNDDIEHLKIMDLNLFPVYGDIKKADIIGKYETIENIIQTTSSNLKANTLCSDLMDHDLEKMVMEISDHFPNLAHKIQTLEQSHTMLTKNTIRIDVDSPRILKKCDDYLKIINQVSMFVSICYLISEICW